jgi:hypothetical protein
MLATLLSALQTFAERTFWTSVLLLLAINGFAIATVLATRDRGLVNRWTSRVLAANLFLLGAGLGVPAAALGARLVVRGLAPFLGPRITAATAAVAPTPAEPATPADPPVPARRATAGAKALEPVTGTGIFR